MLRRFSIKRSNVGLVPHPAVRISHGVHSTRISENFPAKNLPTASTRCGDLRHTARQQCTKTDSRAVSQTERGGFEPPVPFLTHSISSAAQSATLSPLQFWREDIEPAAVGMAPTGYFFSGFSGLALGLAGLAALSLAAFPEAGAAAFFSGLAAFSAAFFAACSAFNVIRFAF